MIWIERFTVYTFLCMSVYMYVYVHFIVANPGGALLT